MTELPKDVQDKLEFHSQFSSGKRGRPKKWTPEVIEQFAKDLLDFAEKPTSLVLADFVLSKRMSPQILSILGEQSASFSEALKSAKRLIAARREKGALTKKLEPKIYGMSQRMYDPEYDAYRLLELEREELIKAKAKIKALKNELDQKGEILKYLESQKKLDEITGAS